MDSAKRLLERFNPRSTQIQEKPKESDEASPNEIEGFLKANKEALNDIKESLAVIEEQIAKLNSSVEKVSEDNTSTKEMLNRSTKTIKEILWAETFNQAIVGCDWMKNVSLSPGRWAVGYQFLYVLFRVLNDFQPKKILELGLGQSTVVTTAYTASASDIQHYVFENDQAWLDFFKRSHSLSEQTEVILADLAMVNVENIEHEVRVYDSFFSKVPDEKYDLIVIDAPFGYDMPKMARIDAIDLIPDRLAESFVIMVDDYNRTGEKSMAKRLLKKLETCQIPYVNDTYSGDKQTLIVCSKDLSFLTTM